MITADHVARAIVTACRETAEDPIAVASGEPGAFRSRHYAMWALLHVFPDLGAGAVATLVGAPYKPVQFFRNSKQNALPGQRPGGGKWWNAGTYQRVIEAIESVEPLPPPEPHPLKVGPLPPANKVHHESKLGMLEKTGYRPPSGTARAILADDEDDGSPVFDRGSIGGSKPRDYGPAPSSKQALYDELRAAVANTARIVNSEEEPRG